MMGCVLKPEGMRRRFKTDNVDFFVHLDERSFDTKVLMIIEIPNNM